MPHTHLLHTQLIQAIEDREVDIVHALINEGVEVNYVNNTCSTTALEKAAKTGDLEIVKLLINSKAKHENYYDRNPLVIALDQGFMEIASFLIETGANVNTDPNEDCTPLLLATHLNSIELVKKIVRAGADVNASGKHSNPAISIAAAFAYKEVYEYLAPFVNSSMRKDFIDEAFYLAASSSSPAGLEFLVLMGEDINSGDSSGETVLMFSAKGSNKDMVGKILELGADKNLKDNHGNTALSLAIEYGHDEIAELLVD